MCILLLFFKIVRSRQQARGGQNVPIYNSKWSNLWPGLQWNKHPILSSLLPSHLSHQPQTAAAGRSRQATSSMRENTNPVCRHESRCESWDPVELYTNGIAELINAFTAVSCETIEGASCSTIGFELHGSFKTLTQFKLWSGYCCNWTCHCQSEKSFGHCWKCHIWSNIWWVWRRNSNIERLPASSVIPQ